MSESLPYTHSMFEQPWWLEATAPNQWDAVEIEESGRVVARLPFVYRKKYGIRIIGQPPLTPTLGPWIEHTSDTPSERLAREKDLFNKLITKLPPFDAFLQNFHPNITNWLPFYWNGFSQTTRYTYVLNGLSDTDTIYRGLGKSTRKNIRRAEKHVQVFPDDGVENVLDMATLSFERQGKKLPYTRDFLQCIDDAVSRHGKKISLVSVDEDGRRHAAVYAIGDERRVYQLVSGNDPRLRQSQSGVLLRWKVAEAAREFTDVYDFEGSMLEGVEEFYRKFGATQTPYFSISKNSKPLSVALALRDLLR